jgi:ABC-2 type transport system ATP-binding protein
MQQASTAHNVIRIDALTKRYGEFTAVRGLDLAVNRAEVFAFLGPNGAGKTTTVRMLMGVLRASSGSATIDGLDCFAQRDAVKRKVGYLPDEPVFYDYLRGREIVRFVGHMHGLHSRDIERRAQPLLERLELEDAADEYAVNYSKGMKKKLALACALLHDPLVLILDEPTNGLDPYATRTLHEIIAEQVTKGRTVFYSTHQLEQAEKWCHRAGIVAQGRIAAVGTLEELREQAHNSGSLEDVFFSVTKAARASEAA